MHFPRHQLAAEQVDHGIQIEELATHFARQIRYVSTPYLIQAMSDMTCRLRLHLRLAAAAMMVLLHLQSTR